ncbi:GDSL esterase/lipase At5g55050-like [Dioscorea cayenensis subsp. rotundata]|uniref:GDSL esterase/lipase At5g55050-like n=1 Tax=Dioscorea cayennensis subsp. rotundata TaxID=55577 RepID=A0AB40CLK8_DIOCR|nr:GDSL esterase/lipase At5g55050-like [Dioscorea cayenensis subsp. rotundata]
MDSSTSCILLMLASFCNMVCFFTTNAQSSSPALFVFGASMLDFGNNIYINSTSNCSVPPYGIDYPGHFHRKAVSRCSNGRNIIDFLVEMLGVPSPKAYLSMSKTRNLPEEFLKGVNFASCSAGILRPTKEGFCIPMDSQIDYYSSVYGTLMEKKGFVQTQRFISNSIFFIDIGNNDILVYNGTGISKYVSLLISTLEGQLKRIYKLGARKFAFMGTEPVGCWPTLRAMNKNTGDCDIEVNQLSVLFNEQAAVLLQKMQSEYADMIYSFFDAYKEFNKYINHPETYGFEEVKAACCGMGFLGVEILCGACDSYCSDRTKYLFWDSWHQTEVAAKLMASAAIDGFPPIVFPINVKQLIGNGLHSQI